MKRFLAIGCLFGAALLTCWSFNWQSATASSSLIQDQDDDMTQREFMQVKLLFSKNILEGLTTRDFTVIKDSAKEIQALTTAAKWGAMDTDEYRKLTDEFQVATKRLQLAATNKNLEASALRFYDMSTRCIDCHEHLRNVKY